jgi:hypothetical protein
MAKRIGTKHTEEAKAKISAANKGKIRGKNKSTEFESKWGMHACDLAAEETVTVDCIHMRVMNFGSPFQRRKKPTRCESLTGRTVEEWARALDMHPVSIDLRIAAHNDPTYVNSTYGANTIHHRRAAVHWTEQKKPLGQRRWLHPRHPNYDSWMAKFKRFDKYFVEKPTC